MVSVEVISTSLLLEFISNTFSKANKKPGIFLWFLPYLTTKVVKGETSGKNFVDLVSLFNYILNKNYLFIHYMDVVSKI